MKNNNNEGLLKKVIYCFFILIFSSTGSFAKEQRVYQTDKFGNIQYHLPSYTVYQTNKYGNIKNHESHKGIKW